jgi:hypothetical protein
VRIKAGGAFGDDGVVDMAGVTLWGLTQSGMVASFFFLFLSFVCFVCLFPLLLTITFSSQD